MASKFLIRTTASLQDFDGTWVNLGPFKTFTGGDFSSTKPKSTRAAGEKEIARAGRSTTGDVTIGRENDGAISLDWFRDRRNRPMSVSRQNLDDDKNPFGNPLVYTGKLSDINVGDGDAEDNGDALDDFTLTVSCDS